MKISATKIDRDQLIFLLHHIQYTYGDFLLLLQEEWSDMKRTGLNLKKINEQIAAKKGYYNVLSNAFEKIFASFETSEKNFSALKGLFIEDPELMKIIHDTMDILEKGYNMIEKNKVLFQVFLDHHQQSMNFWNKILSETRSSYNGHGHLNQGERVSHFAVKA